MNHTKARMVARILFAKDLLELSASFSYKELAEHFPDVDFRAGYDSAWRDLREAAESELAFHLSQTGG